MPTRLSREKQQHRRNHVRFANTITTSTWFDQGSWAKEKNIKHKKMASSANVSVLYTLVASRVERILKEAPWSFTQKRNPLKEACKVFLELLKASGGATSDALVYAAVDALQLACSAGSAKLCEPALDALHKLVAAGLLEAQTAPW